jgi:hypothetical protein
MFEVIKAIQRKCGPICGFGLLITMTAASLYGNHNHAVSFTTPKEHYYFADDKIETIDGLNKWLTRHEINWREAGKSLHHLFAINSGNPVIISIGPAGAMSFYSSLPSIDMLGLNNRYVRITGRTISKGAGHTKLATDQSLSALKSNLNIFHPQTLCKTTSEKFTLTPNVVYVFPFKRYLTVLLPLKNNCYLIADYRLPHPRIEELLANGTILDYRTNQDKFQCPRWLCLR